LLGASGDSQKGARLGKGEGGDGAKDVHIN